jgi:sulfotransferase
MKIHFIAGLPRCGKTMLAAILRQNPRFFHFGMESPVCDVLMGTERQTSRATALTMSLDDEVKRRLRMSVFVSAYGHREQEVCWDTNRFWTAKLPLLVELFPDCKIVCCVRSVAWIMDSFERLYRRSPLELSGLYDYAPNTTVFSRCAKLATSDGVVGRALDALREAYYGEHARHLLLVDYVTLTGDPVGTMKRIYEFVEEPVFLHRFDSLESDNDRFDTSIGSPNLHKVRPQVERVSRETILPPMLFARYANDDFWTWPKPQPKTETEEAA